MMSDHNYSPQESPEMDQATAALAACLMEIERHVGSDGWDTPPRLFALVPTHELQAAEPGLAVAQAEVADHLSAIEQDDFDAGSDVAETLAQISWPPAVHGCALAMVRSMLTPAAEAELPETADAAARFLRERDDARVDIRVVVAVMRSGADYGVARLASHPEELLTGPALMPGILEVLRHTLSEDEAGDQLGRAT